MNWKKFWNSKAGTDGDCNQVARIKNGISLTHQQIQQISDKIIEQLDIRPLDNVLDVCCGNGLISRNIAKVCCHLTGIDISDALIQLARQNAGAANINYMLGSADNFKLHKTFDKILLYFSFQYFDSYSKGFAVIRNLLKHAHPGTIILIGDIPDRRYLKKYYASNYSLVKYYVQFLLGRSNMGKFWSVEELDRICMRLHVKGLYINQEKWQPYSDYRFDYLIMVN